jgi:NADPH-dependent 2,4-dienoyl-CoA reductase/sulfur reductase-like enzyme
MRIIIIGNGIAGTNAARHIRKHADHEVTMISDETLRPFSRTALMYVYMGHQKQEGTELYEDWFWQKNRIQRILGRVQAVDTAQQTVALADGQVLAYDRLIIATGSAPNKFGWPGQDLPGVQGLYHLSDLESMERSSQGLRHAVVVGGGLIGVEMAEMFHSRHISVSFLVREDSFWNIVLPKEESDMINRHVREHGIDLRLGTELKEILAGPDGRAGAVITNHGERIECGFVGLTVGVSPNIAFLKDSGIEVQRGVLVDENLQTSAPNVYAIGDCAQLRTPDVGRRPIEAIWYTGRMMGQTVAKTICGDTTSYHPRRWFNSAKFFDIEYQVYGDIPTVLPEGISTLYWEHSGGKKSIRINYESASEKVTGFNLMGIRYRHEVCEKWLDQGATMTEVLQHLKLANFDPEFFDQYEAYLVSNFNARTGQNIKLSSKRNLNLVQRFLRS